MSQAPLRPSAMPTAADVPVLATVRSRSSILVKFGGLLGIAGSVLGLALLFISCAGYGQAFSWSKVPIGCGVAGLFFTLIGAFFQRRSIGEDTHVLQAFFVSVISIVGGALELVVWMKW